MLHLKLVYAWIEQAIKSSIMNNQQIVFYNFDI